MRIRPGVVINGQIHYPPNSLWLFGFALAGCQWAKDEIEKNEEAFKLRLRVELYAQQFEQGDGI